MIYKVSVILIHLLKIGSSIIRFSLIFCCFTKFVLIYVQQYIIKRILFIVFYFNGELIYFYSLMLFLIFNFFLVIIIFINNQNLYFQIFIDICLKISIFITYYIFYLSVMKINKFYIYITIKKENVFSFHNQSNVIFLAFTYFPIKFIK